MSAAPGRDSLDEGYRRLSRDDEYKKEQINKRRFTQADLDAAYDNGYKDGHADGYAEGERDYANNTSYGYDDSH